MPKNLNWTPQTFSFWNDLGTRKAMGLGVDCHLNKQNCRVWFDPYFSESESTFTIRNKIKQQTHSKPQRI